MIHETDIVRDIGYQDVLKRVRRILYVSHFTREFLQLTFQFNLVVWLVQTESGLFLISLYQSMVNFSVLALVPILSSHIDEAAAGKKLNRKQFSSYVIIAENVCVLVVTLAFSLIIFNIDKGNGNRGLVHCLVGISCLFGASYQVLYEILRITMERDWIVVMASGDDNWLQKTNVVLKQTHLISKILSPVITGEILNNNSGIFWIGGCAVLSLLIELKCIDQMYELLPSLQEPQQRFGEKSIDGEDDNTLSSSCSCRKKIEVYTSQSMVWAGLAYALLYSNVLTFGGLMTAYLVSCDMPLPSIGMWKGLASLVGLFGTFSFEVSQKFMNLETTGLWSIVWEFLCLTVALSGIFVERSDLSATLLIAAVIPSRIGLWVYSISVTQLFQRTVPPDIRGMVGGLQTSLNSLFEFIPFILGMVYSDVSDFSKLAIIGYSCVGAAATFYTIGIYLPFKNGALEYRRHMAVMDLDHSPDDESVIIELREGKLC